jgi:hypothetical protein
VHQLCCQSDLYFYVLDDGKHQDTLDDILASKEHTPAEQRVLAAFVAYQLLVQGKPEGIIDFPTEGTPGNEDPFIRLFGFSVFSNWVVYVERIDGGKVGFSRRFWDDVVSRLDELLVDVLAERRVS